MKNIKTVKNKNNKQDIKKNTKFKEKIRDWYLESNFKKSEIKIKKEFKK